jgi:hypothetical protein
VCGAAAAGTRKALSALLEKRKRGQDAVQQGASGGGEGDGLWRPIEELESKLAFEPGNLLTQRGLRNVEPFAAREKCSSSASVRNGVNSRRSTEESNRMAML